MWIRSATLRVSAGPMQCAVFSALRRYGTRKPPVPSGTPGHGKTRVDKFIAANYTPYAGDGSFLVGPTEKTKKVVPCPIQRDIAAS